MHIKFFKIILTGAILAATTLVTANTSHGAAEKSLSPVSAEENAKIYKAKNRSKNLHILINGGVHGNETLSPEFVLWLKDRYTSNSSPLNQLPFEFSIDFVPVLNSHGFKTNSRYNKNGVNLNRNFPVLWGMSRENPGAAPASESETQTLIKLFKERSYDVAIDIHGYVNWIVVPTAPSQMKFYFETPIPAEKSLEYSNWLTAVKQNLPILSNYEVKTAGGLGDGGSFEDFAFWQANSLPLCLEIHKRAKNKSLRNSEFLSYEKFISKMLENANNIRNPQNIASR